MNKCISMFLADLVDLNSFLNLAGIFREVILKIWCEKDKLASEGIDGQRMKIPC